jgi:hypothetical protein
MTASTGPIDLDDLAVLAYREYPCWLCDQVIDMLAPGRGWRIYGTVRPVVGTTDKLPAGHVTVLCVGCVTAVDVADEDWSRWAEVGARAPAPDADESARLARGLLVGRIVNASVPLTLEQLPAFRATFA